MKKRLLFASMLLITSLSFTAYAEDQTEATTETVTESMADESWKSLESLGKIEVENGLLSVTLTLPAEFFTEEDTQEKLDSEIGEKYISATKNEDGSVTYKLTKDQYKTMLKSITDEMDIVFKGLIDDDESYTISDIEHNDDFSEYNITLDSSELGIFDAFTTYIFAIYSSMYDAFTGNEYENSVINFYDPDHNLIQSFNTDDLKEMS